MNREDKIDAVLSILRKGPESEDMVFVFTETLIHEDGSEEKIGDKTVITWLFRGGKFIGQTDTPTVAKSWRESVI